MNKSNVIENRNKTMDKKANVIHTDNYQDVLADFQNRLISLMNAPDSTCRTEQQLAKLLKLPVRNVKPWVTGTRLPRAEVLPLLSSIYKRPIDWFFGGEKSKPVTYSDAFLSLESLEDIIEIQSIKDPFLSFMMTESARIKYNEFLPEQEKVSWRIRFLSDFDEPLVPEYLRTRIDAGLKIYSQVNYYDTFVLCLKKMTYYDHIVEPDSKPFEAWAIQDANRQDLLNSSGEPRDTSLYPREWMQSFPVEVPEFEFTPNAPEQDIPEFILNPIENTNSPQPDSSDDTTPAPDEPTIDSIPDEKDNETETRSMQETDSAINPGTMTVPDEPHSDVNTDSTYTHPHS